MTTNEILDVLRKIRQMLVSLAEQASEEGREDAADGYRVAMDRVTEAVENIRFATKRCVGGPRHPAGMHDGGGGRLITAPYDGRCKGCRGEYRKGDQVWLERGWTWHPRCWEEKARPGLVTGLG